MPASNAELASAYISLIPSFKGAEAAVTQGMSGMGEAAGQKASGGFLSTIGSVTGRVVGIAAGGVAAVGGLIGGLAIRGGITRSLDIENATAKLAGLGHSTQEVSLIMGNAMTSVKGTAYGMGDAATVAAGAVAAGVKPGADLTRVLKEIADTSTITGLSMGQTGAIFNKVAASNRLNLGDVNQLSQQGLPILDMLAKKYGVSAEAASKMVTQGKVNFQDFSDAIQTNIGGAALKSGNTTQGAFANMGAALSRVGVTLTGGFFPLFKGVFNQVTIILDGLNARIGPSMTRFGAWFQAGATPFIASFGARVLGVFDEVGGGVRAMGAAFREGGTDVTSSGLAGAMERVGLVARAVADHVGPVLAAIGAGFVSLFSGIKSGNFEGLGGNIGKIFSALQNLAQPLGSVMIEVGAHIGAAGTAIGILVGNTLPLLAPLIQIAANAMGFLADHTGLLTPIVIGLAAAFVTYRLGQTAANFAEIGALPIKAATVVSQLALAASNIVLARAQASNTEGVVANTVVRLPAVAQVIVHTAALVAHAIAMTAVRIAMGIATAAQWLWNVAMDANPIGLIIIAIAALVAAIVFLVLNWSTVTAFVTQIWGAFVNWLIAIMGSVASWWSGIWDQISQILQVAWQVIVTVVTAYLNIVQTIIRAVWEVIKVIFSTAWNIIQTIVATALAILIALFTGNFSAIAGYIASAWEKIKGYFTSAFAAISVIVSGAWGRISGIFSSALSGVESLLSGAWNAITGAVSRAWNGIVSFISSIPGRMLSGLVAIAGFAVQMGAWVGGMRDAAVGRFLDLVAWVGGLPGRILGALGNVGGLLSGIGAAIMQSLLDGLISAWSAVTSFVGGIAGWIKDHKGPLSLDAVLLRPAGLVIMGGLNDSLQEQIPDLEKTLGKVTATIATHNMGDLVGSVSATSDLSSIGAQVMQAGGSGRAPAVNYNGDVYGFNPDEAPRKWTRDLADAAAVAGLRNGRRVL